MENPIIQMVNLFLPQGMYARDDFFDYLNKKIVNLLVGNFLEKEHNIFENIDSFEYSSRPYDEYNMNICGYEITRNYLINHEFNPLDLISDIRSKIDSKSINKIIEIVIYLYFYDYSIINENYKGLFITYNSEPIIFFENSTSSNKNYLYFEANSVEDKFIDMIQAKQYIKFSKKYNKNKLDSYDKIISSCYFVGLCALNVAALSLWTINYF